MRHIRYRVAAAAPYCLARERNHDTAVAPRRRGDRHRTASRAGGDPRAAAGIGLYAGAFGITFGAVSAASGLSLTQAVVLSVVMFTGASQFALVGVLAAGGAPLAGLSAALLLGLRNAFYGVPVSPHPPSARLAPVLERSFRD